MARALVVYGPNLNLLGERERDGLAPVCPGVISRFGVNSFLLGLRAAIDLVRR